MNIKELWPVWIVFGIWIIAGLVIAFRSQKVQRWILTKRFKRRQYGIRVVWGIPDEILPLVQVEGKYRLRFRANQLGKVYVRRWDGATWSGYLEVLGGKWWPRRDGLNTKVEIK